jgi:hypothetical protein
MREMDVSGEMTDRGELKRKTALTQINWNKGRNIDILRSC